MSARTKQTARKPTGVVCKFGCGNKCNPGKTPRGNPFDTCCKSCAISKGSSASHDPVCVQRNAAQTISFHGGNFGSAASSSLFGGGTATNAATVLSPSKRRKQKIGRAQRKITNVS